MIVIRFNRFGESVWISNEHLFFGLLAPVVWGKSQFEGFAGLRMMGGVWLEMNRYYTLFFLSAFCLTCVNCV